MKSHWGHIERSSATVQSPWSRYSDSVIPNHVPHLKKWPSPHLNSQPQKYTQEDKCIMYNTFDGHFNPKRKFGTKVESFFLLLFCFVLHFSVGSQFVSLCLRTRDWMLKNGKIQYGLWPILNAEGRLYSAFSFDSSGSVADRIPGITMYTACLEAKRNIMSPWRLF